ncbi:hypothetical protein HDC92_001608 [Pedobacter sp. AK017]|nr:hypothetical protein [Pedobacter sp. AK017]
MDQILSLSTFLYCFFHWFHYNQTIHLKVFRGESQLILFGLNTYVLLSRLTSIAYIGLLWYRTNWYTAIAVLVIGIISSAFVGRLIEKKLGSLYVSLLGFLLIPVLALFMFKYLPLTTS